MADIEELWELCTQTIDKYSERDSDLDDLEDYYFLESTKDDEAKAKEEGIELVHLPHGTNVVDLVQDLLVSTELTVTVPAKSENVTDKSLADVAELYLQTILEQSERVQRITMLSRAAWTVAMRGAVAGRVVPVKRWLEKQKDSDEDTAYEVKDRVPFLIQLRDARQVYPEFGLDGLAFVVDQWKRTVQDVRDSYGDDVLRGKKLTEEVEWREYWDARQYCYWADGEPVPHPDSGGDGPWPHGLGGIPYAFEFARQTAKAEPEKRARPFLAAMRAVIDRMDRLDSMEHTFVGQYIGSSWLVNTQQNQESFRLDLRPGAINYLEPEDRVTPLQGGRTPIELDKARGKLETMFERGTFPGSLFGQDPGRVMAGYAINLLNQSGQVRLNAMVAAIERLFESLLSNVLMASETWLCPAIGGAVPFTRLVQSEDGGGRGYNVRQENSFDARKLDGNHQVSVQVGEILAADEQVNLQMALAARTPGPDQRPLLSDETIFEKFKLGTNQAEERERIERQMALSHPAVQQLTMTLNAIKALEALAKPLKKYKVDVGLIIEQLTAELQPQPEPEPEPEPQPEPMPPGAMLPEEMPPEMPPMEQAPPMGEEPPMEEFPMPPMMPPGMGPEMM